MTNITTNRTLRHRSFRCEEHIWAKFKILCTIEGKAIQDAVAILIEDYVNANQQLLNGIHRPTTDIRTVPEQTA